MSEARRVRSIHRHLQEASEAAPEGLFRSVEVRSLLGLTRRQLQYWSETDLVRPSARTRGGHSRYTLEDLVALKATRRLLDAGVSVQRIRKSIQALRRTLPTVERPLAELVLVATGDVVLVLFDGQAFEAVSGQEWIFDVSQFQREIERWRRGLTPSAARKPRAVRPSRSRARSA